MHERADIAFRQKISLEVLQAFVDARPGLLERTNLVGVHFRRKEINKVEFVKVRSGRGFLGWPGEEWDIVFKVVDGVLVFVGISPGLDEFVPSEFKYGKGSSGGGRRRH